MSDEKIYIYHTNDIHSDLTYWPRIAEELCEKRTIREEKGDFVLAFDLGDAVDRVHPLAEATNGQAVTRLLNQGAYDAVTIGNNEGITNSKKELNELYKEADFSVVLTNLFDLKTNERPTWAKPYQIYQTKENTRIGVFALTVPLAQTYEKLGWKVTNPIKETQDFFEDHWEKADFWILLSHLGINEDRRLAKLFPIPLILGAHTHHVLQNGEKVAASTLTGAGQFGQWLGEVIVNADLGKLRVQEARLFNTETDFQPVKNEQEKSRNYEKTGHQLLKEQKIAKIPMNLRYDWFKQTNLADVVLDAISDYAKTDAAILNAGLFMEDINKGIVTADNLHQTLPHPIRVMRTTIKGKHLKESKQMFQDINKRISHRKVRGYGFRGEVFGKLCMKGLSIKDDQLLWFNQPIQADAEYEIAMIDYFSFLPFFDNLNLYSQKKILFPEFLRTVVGQYLNKTYPYNDYS